MKDTDNYDEYVRAMGEINLEFGSAEKLKLEIAELENKIALDINDS